MTLCIIAQQLFALCFGWVLDSNSVITSCEELQLYEQAKTCEGLGQGFKHCLNNSLLQ
jgi:hypothetical protein